MSSKKKVLACESCASAFKSKSGKSKLCPRCRTTCTTPGCKKKKAIGGKHCEDHANRTRWRRIGEGGGEKEGHGRVEDGGATFALKQAFAVLSDAPITRGVTSWRFKLNQTNSYMGIGVANSVDQATVHYRWYFAYEYYKEKKYHLPDGKYQDITTEHDRPKAGDIIDCTLDMDERTLSFKLNGTQLDPPIRDLPASGVFPAVQMSTSNSISIEGSKGNEAAGSKAVLTKFARSTTPDGNLTLGGTTFELLAAVAVLNSIKVSSGVLRWSLRKNTRSTYMGIGVIEDSGTYTWENMTSNWFWYFASRGYYGRDTPITTEHELPTAGDIIDCVLDMDERTLSFKLNGTQLEPPIRDLPASGVFPAVQMSNDCSVTLVRVWDYVDRKIASRSADGLVVTRDAEGKGDDYTLTTCESEQMHRGKHYWEIEVMNLSMEHKKAFFVGVTKPELKRTQPPVYGGKTDEQAWLIWVGSGRLHGNGEHVFDESQDDQGKCSEGDRVGMLLDLDVGSLRFFKNGKPYGRGYAAGSVKGPVVRAMNLGYQGCSGKFLTDSLPPNSKMAADSECVDMSAGVHDMAALRAALVAQSIEPRSYSAESAKYDLFLAYRVQTDSGLANELYDKCFVVAAQHPDWHFSQVQSILHTIFTIHIVYHLLIGYTSTHTIYRGARSSHTSTVSV
jgi:hypothetical protein